MQVTESRLHGVKILKPASAFEDFRGIYLQTYNQKEYREGGVRVKFVQDDVVVSYKNVLRGIHGDNITWKLVSCLYGRVYAVVVNNDPDSDQFRKWESFVLSNDNRLQLLVPPRFGNSYLTLSDISLYHYKQSTLYKRDNQFTLAWNDPALGIWWPIKNPIVSMRDEFPK